MKQGENVLPKACELSSAMVKVAALQASIPFLLPNNLQTPAIRLQSAWIREGAAFTIQRNFLASKKKLSRVSAARRALWWRGNPSTDSGAKTALTRCIPAVLEQELRLAKLKTQREKEELAKRLKKEKKQAGVLAMRKELTQKHPICLVTEPTDLRRRKCWSCQKPLTGKHVAEVWGYGAEPEDENLYQQARRNVLERKHYEDVVRIDSHTEKEYFSLGGKFRFPDPEHDTYIRGLHARILKLRLEWSKYVASYLVHQAIFFANTKQFKKIRVFH